MVDINNNLIFDSYNYIVMTDVSVVDCYYQIITAVTLYVHWQSLAENIDHFVRMFLTVVILLGLRAVDGI